MNLGFGRGRFRIGKTRDRAPGEWTRSSERSVSAARHVAESCTRVNRNLFNTDRYWYRRSNTSFRLAPDSLSFHLRKPIAMGLRLKIYRETCGAWSVHSPSPMCASTLPSLSASIEYARMACNAAPATLELFVDELYIVVHQERGWPRQLVPQNTDRVHPGETPPRSPTDTEPALRRL
jgi:hypothetical protein